MIKIDGNFNKAMDNYILKMKELFDVIGLSVAVTFGDEIVYSKYSGYADEKNNVAIDSKTLYPIGSLTKSFTAAAIGILVDEGKLDLDTPIRIYIKDFDMYDPDAAKNITMRDILSHKSGLSKHIYWWYNSNLSRKDLVSKIKYLEPLAGYGEKWEYTNIMYILAGHLIEVLYGMTWEEFITEKIFKPLNMNDSYPTPNELDCTHKLARPYGRINGKIEELKLPNLSSVAPAGSMVSTIEDIVKWAIFNMNIEESDNRILSNNYLREMQTKQVDATLGLWNFREITDTGYGLGWFVENFKGEKLVYHSGNIDGFSSQLSFLPDKNISIAVLTNTHSNFVSFGLTYYICDLIMNNSKGKWSEKIHKNIDNMKKMSDNMKICTPDKRTRMMNIERSYDRFKGTYLSEGYGEIVIMEKDGLILELNDISYGLLDYKDNNFIFNHEEYGVQLPITFEVQNDRANSVQIPFGLNPKLKPIKFIRVQE